MTNISERNELNTLVKTYIERKVNPLDFTGVQLKELEEALVSMSMQHVNPEYAEGFLKATGLPESFAEQYRSFVSFDPNEDEKDEDMSEDSISDIGRLLPKTDKTVEAKAKGAKTAFDFVARELGIYNSDSSAEEQLSKIIEKIKELKDAKNSGSVEFAKKLYTTCYHSSSDIPVAAIVKEFKNSVESANEFKSFINKLIELCENYNIDIRK